MFARRALSRARYLAVALLVLAVVRPIVANEEKPKAKKTSPSSEVVIETALQKKVHLEFVDTPLTKVVQRLEETLGVPVVLDQKALDEVGIAADTAVTFAVSEITAESALPLMFVALDLVAAPRDDLLLITTPDRDAEYLTVNVYEVSDLMSEDQEKSGVKGEEEEASKEKHHKKAIKRLKRRLAERHAPQPQADGDGFFCLLDNPDDSDENRGPTNSLAEVITSTIESTTWDDVGGPGSVVPVGLGKAQTLVVAQTPAVHKKIAQLLAALRALPKDASNRSRWAVSKARQEAEAAIREKLGRPVDVDFTDKPLHEVAAWIQKEWGVPIQLDQKALDEVGIAADTPVTLKLQGVAARTVLDRILQPIDLASMDWSEVLLITTPDRIAERLAIRVYNVDDLSEQLSDADQLLDAITSTIEPTTWDEVGGPGALVPYQGPNLNVLVIRQTEEVHDKIQSLLVRLREVAADKDFEKGQ